MNRPSNRMILPGIGLDASGHATVDAPMSNRLIDLAIDLEAYTEHPVDVQHVLAAIILAVRQGQLSSQQALPGTDPQLCRVLARHVNDLFDHLGGELSQD
jgi:hypothetical protein